MGCNCGGNFVDINKKNIDLKKKDNKDKKDDKNKKDNKNKKDKKDKKALPNTDLFKKIFG